MMECERIILYACQTPYKVSSFRSAKLPEIYEYLKRTLEEATQEGLPAANVKKISVNKGTTPFPKRRSTQTDARSKSLQHAEVVATVTPQTAGTTAQVGGKVAKALEKAELRRMKRKLRQAEVKLAESQPETFYLKSSLFSFRSFLTATLYCVVSYGNIIVKTYMK